MEDDVGGIGQKLWRDGLENESAEIKPLAEKPVLSDNETFFTNLGVFHPDFC